VTDPIVELVKRLMTASAADRETLLRLEPGVRTPRFTTVLMDLVVRDPRAAHFVTGVFHTLATADRAFLLPYAESALRLFAALHAGGNSSEALAVLDELARLGHFHHEPAMRIWACVNQVSAAAAGKEHGAEVRVGLELLELLARPRATDFPRPAPELLATALRTAATAAYYDVADFTAALRLAEASNGFAAHRDARLLAGFSFMALEQPERARDLFRQMRADTDDAVVEFNLGGCELALGHVDAGLAAIHRACELDPDNALFALNEAWSLAARDRDGALATFLRAVPLCEALLERAPDRRFTMPGRGRVAVEDAIAMCRYELVRSLIRTGDHANARAHLEVLERGDSTDVTMAGTLRAQLAVASGDEPGALAHLATVITSAGPTLPRLARARRYLHNGDLDAALADLGAIVRAAKDVASAVPLLDEILTLAPGHPAAEKWLGCALTFAPFDRLAHGQRLLDQALERAPMDAYARYRRGLARITLSADRPLDTFTLEDIARAFFDLATAARLAREEAEIQRGFRWLFDRVSADHRFLDLALAHPALPEVMPEVVNAIALFAKWGEASHARLYDQAIAHARAAQALFQANGLPELAARIELNIADSLLRLERLDECNDVLTRFDESFWSTRVRPLTTALEGRADAISANSAHWGQDTLMFELEYLCVYAIGHAETERLRRTLWLETKFKLGLYDEALELADAHERDLRALPALDHVQIVAALHVIPLFRKTGQLDRALALLELVRPHAAAAQLVQVDVARANVLTAAGRREESSAIFSRVLSTSREHLAPDELHLIELSLASLLLDTDPSHTGRILASLAGVTFTSPQAELNVELLKAQHAHVTGAHAHAHAGRAMQMIADLRARVADPDERTAIVESYRTHIRFCLAVMVDAGDGAGALAAFELVQARSQLEEIERAARPHVATEQDAKIERLERIADALRSLIAGVDRLGPEYLDPDASATLREIVADFLAGDDDAPGPPRLSRDKLTARLAVLEAALERETRRRDKATAQAITAAPAEPPLRDILDALGTASVHATWMPLAGEVVIAIAGAHGVDVEHTGVAWQLATDWLATDAWRLDPLVDHPDLRRVIQPIVDRAAPGQHVVLSVTDDWARVPFHAIAVDGEPFAARNSISFTPSLRLLARCVGLPPAAERALVIGDPRHDLPKARDEARAVAATLGVAPVIGAAATVDEVLRQLAHARTGHVHFACHGYADTEHGMQSGLLMAPAHVADDGRLRAADLVDAELDGARVVLSACETGLGEARGAGETFGLPRALLEAGARCVIVSLWKTHDLAAHFLFDAFYAALPRRGAARALADSQAHLRGLSARDALALCERRATDDVPADARARALLDRAAVELAAADFAAAARTYDRIVAEHDAAAAPAEVARALHHRALVDKRGALPSIPDYDVRPFAAVDKWAPFILLGDWQ
jgi:CHAT domain-containing protein/tetratricopeptide (TPR) repeat protein